ncbi:MAG: alanine--tRNA ligase, partial [Campylobacter sp.]|nr:alanine--tRNA ligase [Campylobacter sp.]
NEFVGYEKLNCESKILAILDENFNIKDEVKSGETAWLMLERTPFYAASGGQCADIGTIGKSAVLDTQKFFDLNLSAISAAQTLKTGDTVECEVDAPRRTMIARHHSATHLLHAALRKILGEHVTQAGSLVEPSRLRFDFSHPKAMSEDEILAVQSFVNEAICRGAAQKMEIMDIGSAKNSGAIALFGEKYGADVRVVSFGEVSKELCGGTHVNNISEIGAFLILKESGVSAGVRRIEAICSQEVVKFSRDLRDKMSLIEAELKGGDPIAAIKKLKSEIKELKQSAKTAKDPNALSFSDVIGVKLCVAAVDGGDIKTMIDEFKNSHEKAAIMLMQAGADGKISIAAGVKNAPIKAGEWVKLAAQILGGGGGGRDD